MSRFSILFQVHKKQVKQVRDVYEWRCCSTRDWSSRRGSSRWPPYNTQRWHHLVHRKKKNHFLVQYSRNIATLSHRLKSIKFKFYVVWGNKFPENKNNKKMIRQPWMVTSDNITCYSTPILSYIHRSVNPAVFRLWNMFTTPSSSLLKTSFKINK